MSKDRRKGGFTLVEVVVAMAVLGISLVLVIELFSGGLRLARASEEYTVAAQLARQKLEEISLNHQPEEGVKEGDFDHMYRWQVDVKKTELLPFGKETDYSPPAELYQIQVRIIWKSGNQERMTRIDTFKAVKRKGDETKTI